MSRINTNVSSLIAQRVLANNNQALNTSLQRLSTGLKINSGADDPAGLIASQNLEDEKQGITTAIDNAGRASNILGTADGGLSEVSNLLTQLQGLVSQAANTGGLSNEEISANQLQVDSILSTINRIAGSTSFQGQHLLNGALDYTTSGVTTTNISNLQVNAARVPDGGTTTVTVAVTASAKTAAITSTAGTVGHGGVTLEISGNTGTQQLSFASGTTVSSIATAINAVTNTTGLSAQVSGTGLRVNSTGYGASQFVAIRAITGSYALSSNRSTGSNAAVNVNGASAYTDGLHVSYRNQDLDVQFDLAKSFDKVGSTSFTITGGGANFSIGSKVTESNKASIGIASVSTGSLGDATDGYLTSLGTGGANSLTSTNLTVAQGVIDSAIKQVSELRGRLGAFQKFTIGSTVNSLGVALENADAAESAIRDTNFAEETSNLTRNQILSQAATTVLAQANSSPQSALSLLRGA
jgi:flagellin